MSSGVSGVWGMADYNTRYVQLRSLRNHPDTGTRTGHPGPDTASRRQIPNIERAFMSEQSAAFLPIAQQQILFRELVADALSHAKRVGASDAVAEVSESKGLVVSVREGDIETIEQTRDRSMDVTVYAGKRRGSASTSDFSAQALRETVEAAWHIARYTAEDDCAGLPDSDRLATGEHPDFQLHHPWAITADEAASLAIRAEKAARDLSPLITNTDGASIGTFQGHFVLGNTAGFMGGYPYRRHSIGASPIAGKGSAMQRDYWYSTSRDWRTLAEPEAVGRYAAQRTLSRLSARRIKTGRFPVLFEAPLAVG